MKKTAQEIADDVLFRLGDLQRKRPRLSSEEIKELQHDIGDQITFLGGEQAAQVIPQLGSRVREIGQGTPEQLRKGIGGALIGSGLGAGTGLLLSRLSKGEASVPYAALSMIPTGFLGYGIGKGYQQRKELLDLLNQEYGQ